MNTRIMQMHIMVDLETLGTNSNAPIISIGAVAFNMKEIVSEFYANVDFDSAVKMGDVDGSTVAFWFKQEKEAREKFFDGAQMSLFEALSKFYDFVNSIDSLEGVWGNGASFDNTILVNAFTKSGMNSPWPFWKDRCYRTLKNEFPEVPFSRVGVHHNALDDAKSQATHLIEIWRYAHGEVI